jgi:rubrerythrin
MGVRLLPLSVAELSAHALELERDAAVRFREYAARMHDIGEGKTAEVFEDMQREQDAEVRALEAAAGDRRPSELSPWEYVWRLTYMPEKLEQAPRLVPLSAREALQLSLLAKRRAEAFYDDVADNARDDAVRGCAAEMLAGERQQVQYLEWLLNAELHEERETLASGPGDRPM